MLNQTHTYRFSRSFVYLFFVLVGFGGPSLFAEEPPAKAEQLDTKAVKYKTHDDAGWKNNDGKPFNKRHSLILLLGPGSAQNGQPNPLGIPPGVTDIDFTYVHPTGIEGSAGVIPGITMGMRYRTGSSLYGSAGAGLIISARGAGPGVYTALGATITRMNRVSFDIEFKQALGMAFGPNSGITTPYAFRMGAGYHW